MADFPKISDSKRLEYDLKTNPLLEIGLGGGRTLLLFIRNT